MKQHTSKNFVRILDWIRTTPHHIVQFEQRLRRESDPQGNSQFVVTHIALSNYHEKLRVPMFYWLKLGKLICANRRPFDTRMFTLTPLGFRLLKQHKERNPS